MAKHKDFTLSEEFSDIEPFLQKWAKEQNASRKICLGIRKQIQEETAGEKIDNFIKYETTLDTLPRMWEVITKDDLKKLSDADLGRLYKMMHVNMDIVRRFIDSYEQKPRVV